LIPLPKVHSWPASYATVRSAVEPPEVEHMVTVDLLPPQVEDQHKEHVGCVTWDVHALVACSTGQLVSWRR